MTERIAIGLAIGAFLVNLVTLFLFFCWRETFTKNGYRSYESLSKKLDTGIENLHRRLTSVEYNIKDTVVAARPYNTAR